MCLCSHGCTGSRGWCIAACKAELSVSFNSLSQRSNRMYSHARRLRPLTGSATLYKTNSRIREHWLGQAQKNNRERQALNYTDRESHSICSHMCPRKYESSNGLSRKITSLSTTLNNSDTCGATQCGSQSKACYQSKIEDTCSTLSGSRTASVHYSASVSLSEVLVCRNCCAYCSPQANQQVDNSWLMKIPSGLHQTQCCHIHRTVRTRQWPKSLTIINLYSQIHSRLDLNHIGLEIKKEGQKLF